jgi:hypothetical protein
MVKFYFTSDKRGYDHWFFGHAKPDICYTWLDIKVI